MNEFIVKNLKNEVVKTFYNINQLYKFFNTDDLEVIFNNDKYNVEVQELERF